MNIEKSLAEYLRTVPSIKALIGDRVYWPHSPQAISVTHVRVEPAITQGHHNKLDYAAPEVQVSAFGRNIGEVIALRNVLLPIFRNTRLVVGGAWAVSVLLDDQLLMTDGWWHAPITVGLRYQEV